MYMGFCQALATNGATVVIVDRIPGETLKMLHHKALLYLCGMEMHVCLKCVWSASHGCGYHPFSNNCPSFPMLPKMHF
jgi:hypothetical protein